MLVSFLGTLLHHVRAFSSTQRLELFRPNDKLINAVMQQRARLDREKQSQINGLMCLMLNQREHAQKCRVLFV